MSLAIHVFGFSQLGYILLLLGGGYICSKYGYKASIVIGISLYCILPIAIYYSLDNKNILIFLATLSGVSAGLSRPAGKVHFYNLFQEESRAKIGILFYCVSGLACAGYFLGHILYKTNPALPFYISMILSVGALVTFSIGPSIKVDPVEKERSISLDKYWILMKEYTNRSLLLAIALLTLLAAGASLYFFSGVIGILKQSHGGRNLSLVMVIMLFAAIAAQILKKSSSKYLLMGSLFATPVVGLTTSLIYSHVYLIATMWFVHTAISINIRLKVFQSLHRLIEVRSGIQMSLYILGTSIGAILSYVILVTMNRFIEMKYAFIAYSVLFGIVAIFVCRSSLIKEEQNL
jgi:MFS family permease